MSTKMIRVETDIPEDVYLTLRDHQAHREKISTHAANCWPFGSSRRTFFRWARLLT